MAGLKRPFSPFEDEQHTSLPPSRSLQSYTHKKRRKSTASLKQGVYELAKHVKDGFMSVWSPARKPKTPASESGTSVSSASTAATERERRRHPNDQAAREGRENGGPSTAGPSKALVNGYADRPRTLDDMLRSTSVDSNESGRQTSKTKGRRTKSRSGSSTNAIDDLFKGRVDIDEAPEKVSKGKGRQSTSKDPSPSSPAGPSRSSLSPGSQSGTVKGKGKARAILDIEDATTPTQLGTRNRPVDLTRSSQIPIANGDPSLPSLYLGSSPDPIASSSSVSSPDLLPTPLEPTSPSSPSKLHFDLSNDHYQRDYSWLSQTRRSPNSVTSSTTSNSRRNKLKKKKSFNIMHQTSARAQAHRERVLHTRLENEYNKAQGESKASIGRVMKHVRQRKEKLRKERETSYQNKVAQGLSSINVLQSMISALPIGRSTQPKPVVDVAQQFRGSAPSTYDHRKPLAVAQDARRRNDAQPYQSNVHDILGRMKLEDDEIEARLRERFAPKIPKTLTSEQTAIVQKSLNNRSFEVIHGVECVTHKSLERLRPGTWLDDEVINFYGSLIKAREDKAGHRKIHYFNSFFYAKLESQGYVKSKLARWTKKVDIFAMDLIVFPINVGSVHWTAGAIDFKKKQIEYYDSLGDGRDLREVFFENIREYLNDEHMDKKKKEFDLSDWEDKYNEDSPQQSNGSDCGVFSCQTLENRSRGLDLVGGKFEFKAANMPYFRELMMWEITTKQLRDRW